MGKAKKNERDDTACALYGVQNKLLHRGFAMAGFGYNDHKDYWIDVISGVVKRKVKGLSGLNLGERSALLSHLAKNGGGRIFNPHVPRHWTTWQKGDPEPKGKIGHRPMHVPKHKKPLVSKIHAVLADMKLPWSYVDTIARDRFQVQFVEWLEMPELIKVVQMMVVHQERHGGPNNFGGKNKKSEVNDAS